jgi:uncharacterized membrane protein
MTLRLLLRTMLVTLVVVGYPVAMHLLLTSGAWPVITLLPGREPLISQLARRVHREDYGPEIARYTRQATWAWTLYFVAMGLASVLLFLTAPLVVWSWFVNFLSFLTLGAMFVAEYAVRRWRLRGIRHMGFLQGVKLYWDKPGPAEQRPSQH